jgi:hypothetical protein
MASFLHFSPRARCEMTPQQLHQQFVQSGIACEVECEDESSDAKAWLTFAGTSDVLHLTSKGGRIAWMEWAPDYSSKKHRLLHEKVIDLLDEFGYEYQDEPL